MRLSVHVVRGGITLALLVFLALVGQSGNALGRPLVAHSPISSKATQTQLPPSSGDWPMYGHDWGHTSYNPAETALSADNLDQLESRWQANVGISDFPTSGAPSVANGRVYVGSSVTHVDNFFSFDAITGTLAWSTDLGNVNDCALVGIGSTSAISGSVLSVGGGDHAYYGLNANTGARLWRDDLNVGYSGFAWASPLLAHGRSYIGIASNCDAPSVRGEVRALDIVSGTLRANQYFVPSDQAGAGVWQSPALSPDGNTLIIATGEDYREDNGPYNRAIVSLDPITLQIRQANQQGALNEDQDFGTSPVVFHDSQGRVLVGAGHKDDIFYAYELDNIQAGPIWQLGIGTNVGMMPAYDPNLGEGGTLFVGGQSGVESTLYAVDPGTGAIRWGPVPLEEFHGNVAVANGLIFVNGGDAGVHVLDEATGEILRTLLPAHAGKAFSGIAVANGFIYWLSGPYLNAWSLPDYVPPTSTVTVTGTPPTATRTFTPTPTVTGTLPTSTPTRTSTGTRTPRPTVTATPTRGCSVGWEVVASQNIVTNTDNVLTGISSFLSDDVWSVGYYRNGSAYQTLAEFWNGWGWNVVNTPNVGTGDNYLQGVYDRAGNDAWAVGYQRNGGSAQTLIEHWNGMYWEVIPSPNVGSGDNYLNAVTARAGNDAWAVGYYRNGTTSRTLIMHWNGNSWSVTSSPNGAGGGGILQGVEYIADNDAWAVGFEDGTLIEHWNGSRWSVVPSPSAGTDRNVLQAIDAINADDIWAVGYYRSGLVQQSLTEHWNGTQWSIIPTPTVESGFNPLFGVAADSPDNVWAVGYYQGSNNNQTLIEHWDGTQWNALPGPNVNNSGMLNSVTSVSATDFWAAGDYIGSYSTGSTAQTLIEHYSDNPCTTGTATPTLTPTATRGTFTATATATATLPCPPVTVDNSIQNFAFNPEVMTITVGSAVRWTNFDTVGHTATSDTGVWDSGNIPHNSQYSFTFTAPGVYTYYCIPHPWMTGTINVVANCLPTATATSTATSTLISTHTATATTTSTYTATSTSTSTALPTSTPTYTNTSTSTPASVLVGHITWQGRPAQPNALQQLPFTLTLRSGSTVISYPNVTTNASGSFTVTLGSIPQGTYSWWAKGPKFLANSGTVQLTRLKVEGSNPPIFSVPPSTSMEMGLMRAGDANNDNLVTTLDFNTVKVAFGKGFGELRYDDRADFTGDRVVSAQDFNLLHVNFGSGGAPLPGP